MKIEMAKYRIKDICHLEKGQQIDTDLLDDSNRYRYVNGGIEASGNYGEYNTVGKTIMVSEGGASCGYVNYTEEPFWCGCHCYKLTGISVNPRYLFFALKANQTKIMGLRTGSAMPNIKKSLFEEFELSLSGNESEQIHVVEVLDKIGNLIDQRKSQIKYFDELLRARFVEMFGNVDTGNYRYKTYKLGDVASVGSSHRVFTTEFVEKGVPFYRGTEIGELANGIKPTEPYFISKEQYNRLANDDTKPQIGDLLMPSICNKGQVWMVDTKEPFYYKDGRVLCISPDREIFDTKYLEYFMRVKTLVTYPKLGSGSTFAEFKIFLLKGIDVLVPPRNLQEQFADFVRQVDKSKIVGFLKRTTDTEMYMSKFDSIL